MRGSGRRSHGHGECEGDEVVDGVARGEVAEEAIKASIEPRPSHMVSSRSSMVVEGRG